MIPNADLPLRAFSNALTGTETPQANATIMIYADDGAAFEYVEKFLVDQFPDTLICRVTGKDLRDSEWLGCQSGMLVIPGIKGEECPYYDQIGEQGRDNIKDFLERDENILMTFCAGTYVINEQIHYNISTGGFKSRTSPIALIAGKAEGPPEGLSIRPQDDFTLTRIAYQNGEGQETKALLAHGNGPALDEDSITAQNGVLLGRYDDIEGKPAAGFKMPFGKGCIIALGTIPYFEPYDPSFYEGSDAFDKIMTMVECEPDRQAYCNLILSEIARHKPDLKPKLFDVTTARHEIGTSTVPLEAVQ